MVDLILEALLCRHNVRAVGNLPGLASKVVSVIVMSRRRKDPREAILAEVNRRVVMTGGLFAVTKLIHALLAQHFRAYRLLFLQRLVVDGGIELLAGDVAAADLVEEVSH